MRALAAHVREGARRELQALRVSEIVALIDRAVMRLLDADDPARRELDELLPRVTGYDPQMVRLGLGAYLQAFRAPQLHRFVAEDFANPKVLDEFQPARKGGFVRAIGPALLVHHWAGNVPGLPLWSLASGLLVKAGSVGKLPSAEPVFASVVARLLCELHPPLADALAVTWWPGGEPEPASTLHAQADTVLAYGGDAAIAQLRQQVPAGTRFLPYGHKLGLSLVARCALDAHRGPPLARAAALDVVRWEQQGCYSPHVIYVERGGAVAPRDFAQYLAAELAQLAQRFARRPLSLEESAALAGWRHAAEARAWGGEGDELFAADDGAWAVAFSPRARPLAPTPGWRCVQVVAVDALEAAADALAPHAGVLQSAGVAAAPARLFALAERLASAGVTRIAALGALALPEAGWHHDGRFNLLDLVRMVEIEASAERAADRLAPYAQEDAP
ncbi:acyl-CoA reductase [Ramlibacter rhizophilus]|uniref:Acyl-CoA reductase n=2 Tax=Ramlibacter rhizophilus TaxID=1781167 RepID=A0A4Z0BJ89_9BURK|nr:acyl-CoA reductase [Ramlibacter rhizophilus]